MNRWVISDLHLNHKNIISYCSRPFSSVEEMNETIIQNWNKVVRDTDEVFCLGDFALCGKDKIIEFGRRLRGRKRLILGNHEGASLQTYHDAGFDMVVKYPIIVDDYFIMSHMPQNIQKGGIYANIFGHIHTNPEFKDVSPQSFCACVERINYTPIELDEIIQRMEACRDEEERN